MIMKNFSMNIGWHLLITRCSTFVSFWTNFLQKVSASKIVATEIASNEITDTFVTCCGDTSTSIHDFRLYSVSAKARLKFRPRKVT